MAAPVRSKKLFLGVRDNDFPDRRQFSILTTLTDGNELFTNQYVKLFTTDEIGSFDVRREDDLALLEFVALDSRINYSYSFISYDTKQFIYDTDSIELGNTVNIETNNTIVEGPVQTTVFTIPQDVTSGKILLETTSQDAANYEYNELNFVSTVGNGVTNVYYSEFGKLTVSNTYPSGLGTYGITSNGDVIFSPTASEEFRTNVIGVSIASTAFSAVSSQNLRYANVESIRVSIGASPAPIPVSISQYTSTFNSAYYVVQIVGVNTITQEKSTQLVELATLNNEADATIVEYGTVTDNEELGTFDVNSASLVDLFFTPIENTDIDITLLQHTVTYTDFDPFPASINFNNAELTTGVTKFNESSDSAFKKDFNLTHKGIPIFERRFNGSLSTEDNAVGIDLDNDLIYLPNHYFITGEKINYRSQGAEFIALTDTLVSETAGIGTDIVYLDSTFSIQSNDFIKFDGTSRLSISGIGSTSVTLRSELQSQVNAGTAATIFRLNQGVDNLSTLNSIGIAQTFISGVGNTDKLSGDLFVYKKDNLFIGFGTSPSDVISEPPKLINLTSTGTGSNHYVTSTNQNSKCLLAIDNMIQSPVVSTSTTTLLSDDLEIIETTVFVSSIDNFAAGSLLKIDDELMKVSSIGVGTTALEFQVQRPFLGTSLGVHTAGSVITKFTGNYNIVGSKVYFAEAPYGPIFDPIQGNINIRSTFQGRSFMRSADPTKTERNTYKDNYVFDTLEDEFNGIQKDFTLKSLDQSITGFSTSNGIVLINGIFQNPTEDYDFVEESGETEIRFTGTATSISYDVNNGSVPRGGIPIAIGSSQGFGYQPLISAGGTAIVSPGGSIQSVSIGYSGSGYRKGIQTIVNVGVQTASTGIPNIEFIGTATVSNGNIVSVNIDNPGSGYDPLNPPAVVFDEPFSYTNLDLIYQSPSTGIGTEAKIDIVVGQGSSVIDFKIKNYGYSYRRGDILTVGTGGTTGIQTVPSVSFEPFSIIIDDIRTDEFSGWSIGELEKIDDLDSLANGFERTFPISKNQTRFAILARPGSTIDLAAVLVIFVNDVLQEPNVAYTFSGGSLIEFTEPLPNNCKCRVYFYKGTPDVDVIDVDLLETVQTGDTLQIVGDTSGLTQESRLVKDVFLADTVKTNNYNTVGVSSNNELLRSVTWCKQREDTLVDGIVKSKSRISYEPSIYPTSNILQTVGSGSTIIYVDNVTTIFNQSNENVADDYIDTIELIESDAEIVGAAATAIVSSQGEVQSITITNTGQGYSQVPEVSISYPPSGIVTHRATATATLNGDSINSISITGFGTGYSSTNPPKVIVGSPTFKYDTAKDVTYSGDFGIVTGVSKSGTSTEMFLDLYIPQNSFLRDLTYTNDGGQEITQSQIEVGDYLRISNAPPITGEVPLVSRRIDDSIIGIATTTATGISNVYQVASVTTESRNAYGFSANPTNLTQVKVYITDNSPISTGSSEYLGDFSWGKIQIPPGSLTNTYSVSNPNIDTPIVRRVNPLKYSSYTE